MSEELRGPLRVLYLSPFEAFGGATRSLIEVMRALDPARVEMHAVVGTGVAGKGWFPPQVTLTEVSGLMQLDHTRFGHYRGLRWLIPLREIANLPATRRMVREMRERPAFDLIHCNEITLLPAAILLKKALKVPLVVHVRSVQMVARTPRRTALVTRLLSRHADAIVAIDQAVQRTLDPSLKIDVIHNSMVVPPAPRAVADHDRPLTFGIIGSLSVSKGVVETVQACSELRRRCVPFQLLIAGENVRTMGGLKGWVLQALNLSHDIEADLRAMIAKHDLGNSIEMLGFVRDVDAVYDRLDVLCFPSRLDAPGRPVFEAALKGIPAIVAMRDPTNDVIVKGVTGLLVDGPDPVGIADAMEWMHRERSQTRMMGEAARTMAAPRFDSAVAVGRLMAVYNRVVLREQV